IADGLEKFSHGLESYQGWSKEELIKEISELKKEIKNLKSLEISGDYGKTKIKEFSRKLEQKLLNSQFSLEALQESKNNDNAKFPIIPIISAISVISLLGFVIIYKTKKNKTKN